MKPLSDEQRLARMDREDAKERRRRLRRLTYSPGEQIWIGITFVTLIILWVVAF
jgi:hypothetical protein